MASKSPNTLKLQLLQAQGESVSVPTTLKLERVDHLVTCSFSEPAIKTSQEPEACGGVGYNGYTLVN